MLGSRAILWQNDEKKRKRRGCDSEQVLGFGGSFKQKPKTRETGQLFTETPFFCFSGFSGLGSNNKTQQTFATAKGCGVLAATCGRN